MAASRDDFSENNGRLDVFRVNVILQASEGAKAVSRGQGRAPPAGPTGAAAAARPWPVGAPPRSPFGLLVPSVE